MTRIIHGVVHGNTIELKEHPGVPDGQEVEVVVRVPAPARAWGEGIRRSAGAMAEFWTEEDDKILEELAQDRRQDSRREIPE
jgi:hypothetical protein